MKWDPINSKLDLYHFQIGGTLILFFLYGLIICFQIMNGFKFSYIIWYIIYVGIVVFNGHQAYKTRKELKIECIEKL